MKVFVTNNIETDLDVTNSAQGEIVNIILHPDEPPISANEPIVHLKYLPSHLLVKLSHTQASQLAGLEDTVILVGVETSSMKISIKSEVVKPWSASLVKDNILSLQFTCSLITALQVRQYLTLLLISQNHPVELSLCSTCMLHFHGAQDRIPLDYFVILMRDYSYSNMTWISWIRMISWKN